MTPERPCSSLRNRGTWQAMLFLLSIQFSLLAVHCLNLKFQNRYAGSNLRGLQPMTSIHPWTSPKCHHRHRRRSYFSMIVSSSHQGWKKFVGVSQSRTGWTWPAREAGPNSLVAEFFGVALDNIFEEAGSVA